MRSISPNPARHKPLLRDFRKVPRSSAGLARLALRWMLRMAPLLALLVLPVMPVFAGQGDDGNAPDNARAAASAASSDKGTFDLFNPTPAALMRELSPDRPDKTESPYTVDAGHFQLEMDFANDTLDRSQGVRTQAWNVAPINFKVGILNNADLQFVFDDYLNVRTTSRAAGTASTQSGIGDFTTRLKINLWGDDSGKTAFAILPYVKFPVNTDHLGNNGVEGGILFPLTLKLPADFEATLETGEGVMRNDEDSGYHAEVINSISVDHPIIGKLSGYVEFFSDISTERHSGWLGTADTGLEYLVTENVQLDCGCNFGVTRAADNFNPFAGITVRF